MGLVQKFLESEWEESLPKKFEDYFNQNEKKGLASKITYSDTDGAEISFAPSVFPDYAMKRAMDAINKEFAKDGREVYVQLKDYKGAWTIYDIEERPIEFKKMVHGTLDLGGHWDTHYRFEKVSIGVVLPNGKKVVYVKTQELSSELTDNGIGQMKGHHDKWLFEPVTKDPDDGYFIVSKDTAHPYAGEDCIATWYSGAYGNGDPMSADDFFGTDVYDESKGKMSEEELDAFTNVLHYFIHELGFPADVFGDGFGHYKDENDVLPLYEDTNFNFSLECLANAIDDYFDENEDAKEIYAAWDEDLKDYKPFTVDDLYDMDEETGAFGLPGRN